ncbi:MAG: hypothetical protein JJE12_03365 [Anaerolineales bacterium]|nr:hypothetical protein [Anaerolineales bacterium]
MRRRSTIFSLPSMLIFGILLVGLGLTIWRQGGLAFSPGDLSITGNAEVVLAGYESHADFEEQCGLCHQPLTSLQADLCMDCHTNIGEQATSRNGLHGKFEDVMQCFECHTDHKGREHDLRLGSLEGFDHSLVAFSLIWHQADYGLEPISCTGCHVSDDQFSVQNTLCTGCHVGAEGDFVLAHILEFGDGCVDCHDGLDSMARFDHANSDFHLEGVHQDLECAECHLQGQFDGLPGECAACHAEPAEHLGMFGSDCSTCHDSAAWSPARVDGVAFDHNTNARFTLDRHQVDFDDSIIACQSCHQEGQDEFSEETCFGCHALNDQSFVLQHQAELGSSCLECHDGVDRMRSFNHEDVFRLDGSHVEIECQACHINQLYQGTPAECKDCHAEPEIHLGYFGLTCEYCHETSSWYPAQLTQHTFPIDHGDQGESECQTCHIAAYDDYTCFTCHEHSLDEVVNKHSDLNLTAIELSNCAECHLDGQVHEFSERED